MWYELHIKFLFLFIIIFKIWCMQNCHAMKYKSNNENKIVFILLLEISVLSLITKRNQPNMLPRKSFLWFIFSLIIFFATFNRICITGLLSLISIQSPSFSYFMFLGFSVCSSWYCWQDSQWLQYWWSLLSSFGRTAI